MTERKIVLRREKAKPLLKHAASRIKEANTYPNLKLMGMVIQNDKILCDEPLDIINVAKVEPLEPHENHRFYLPNAVRVIYQPVVYAIEYNNKGFVDEFRLYTRTVGGMIISSYQATYYDVGEILF